MPLHIVLGDLTTFKADVIVNSAHPLPQSGTGVDSALYAAAGPGLLKARQDYGLLQTGDCVKTEAFSLKARAVYHVITPHINSIEAITQLETLYQTLFQYILEDEVTSVALPLLSSGNHQFPKATALRIAREQIGRILTHHDLDVTLVIYDKAQVELEAPPVITTEMSIQLKTQEYSMAHEAFEIRSLSFHAWLFHQIDALKLDDPMVYKRANLTRQHFSKIRSNPDYQPTKNTVIALALALELNLDQTLDFLATAGYALSSSLLFDVIIEYHIEHQIYDIYKVNEVLFLYDQRTLG